MVEALGGHGLKVIARIQLLPSVSHERPINVFKSGTGPFVAHSKQATSQVELIQVSVVEEPSKLAHASAIQAQVVLVLSLVDYIEIPSDEPRVQLNMTQLLQL
jgi:hypothetical protein